MFLGRIKGHVVATAKDASVVGQRLLIVEPLKVAYTDAKSAGQAPGKKAAKGSGLSSPAALIECLCARTTTT